MKTKEDIEEILDELCSEWQPVEDKNRWPSDDVTRDLSVVRLLELISALIGNGEFYHL